MNVVPVMPPCVDYSVPCKSSVHVAAGAAWLDASFPGWERKVDVALLNIESATECICGQVVPLGSLGMNGPTGWDEAEGWICKVTNNGLSDVHLGFCHSNDQDAWVHLLKERFDSGLLSDTEVSR